MPRQRGIKDFRLGLGPLLCCVLLSLWTACGGGSGGGSAPPPQTYTVTFLAGTGGTLTGSTTQTVTSGGSATAVTAVPAPGYVFTGWNGTGFASTGGNPLTVTNVTTNLTLTATFTQQTFTVSFLPGTGGSLTGSTTQTVAYGGSATAVIAVPATGYTFSGWSGPGFTATSTNPLTVTNVTANLTLTATFTQQTFTVSFLPGTGGSLTGSATQTVAYGGSASAVTAVPATGYTFTGWSGTGFTATSSNPLTVSNVTANLTVTATFTQQTFTVSFLAGMGGNLTGSATQTVAYGGSATAVTAVPAMGYTFTGWSGPGFPSTSTNPLMVSNVTANLTLTATFTQQTFTVSFLAGMGGNLTGSATQTVAYGGSATAVTAVPATGYTFSGWSGTGFTSTSTNPLTVANVTANLTVTATFAVLRTVTFLAGANGTLTGATTQSVADGGNATAVTAVPNPGYALVSWTGPGFPTTSSNPLTVTNVTADLTLTATFARLPVIGSFTALSSTVGRGMAAYLSWSGLSNYTSASIDNGVGAVVTPNGMLSAYPTADTTYTLTATNAAGSITLSVAITVVPPPTINTFTATPATVAAGAPTTLAWSVTGATTLTIDNGVGVVTGTSIDVIPPMGATATATTYKLTASSSYGTRYAYATVTSGPPASLTYSQNPATYLRTVAITPNVPSHAAGPITAYAVLGTTLPPGLSLDPTSGVISGTPTAVVPTTTYVIRGSNTYGFTAASVVLTVTEPPPVITYTGSTYALPLGVPVSLFPINTGGQVVTWSITPTLPTGLAFSTSTGAITGTPTVVASAQTYTITATNSGGTSTPALAVSVVQAVPHIAYPSGTYSLYLNQAISALMPVNSGGAATSWSIDPPLSAGLSFDAATGRITGTPTAAAATQTYTVTAVNAGGSGVTSLVLVVGIQPPVITVQPSGKILAPGLVPTFGVTATGAGLLTYQWYLGNNPIVGATLSTYTAPAFQAADDGAAFAVVVSDGFGGSTTSAPARISLFLDLGTWLMAHPAIAAAIKWQVQSGDPFNYYIAPGEAQKVAWASWSPTQQADLDAAYRSHVDWFNAGAPQVTMVPGGTATTLSDQPTNLYSQIGLDANATMVQVSPADMWRLYTSHVAFSLMLELSQQVPWTLTGYASGSLRWLFDSSTMAWLQPNGTYGMGTYPGANQPALRDNNRPRTQFADPRWTFPWLQQAGIIGASRRSTIGGFLDYMRHNLYHAVGGADTFGSDYAIWQYRGYSPVSRIVLGTVDSRYPELGNQHFTEGCHGSTGFINAALRILNIPVQPIWVCGHELLYFMSEDLYLDHADDPYNGVVLASSSPSLLLLMDSATWRSRFGADETLNNWDYASPVIQWIGYAAQHFP